MRFHCCETQKVSFAWDLTQSTNAEREQTSFPSSRPGLLKERGESTFKPSTYRNRKMAHRISHHNPKHLPSCRGEDTEKHEDRHLIPVSAYQRCSSCYRSRSIAEKRKKKMSSALVKSTLCWSLQSESNPPSGGSNTCDATISCWSFFLPIFVSYTNRWMQSNILLVHNINK